MKIFNITDLDFTYGQKIRFDTTEDSSPDSYVLGTTSTNETMSYFTFVKLKNNHPDNFTYKERYL